VQVDPVLHGDRKYEGAHEGQESGVKVEPELLTVKEVEVHRDRGSPYEDRYACEVDAVKHLV